MIRIRRFAEKCFELYQARKLRGFLHLYEGKEAVSVGIMQALMPEGCGHRPTASTARRSPAPPR
jgi:TPP-dependent pyruvate/acetoin dehydrogenase alpha subunit